MITPSFNKHPRDLDEAMGIVRQLADDIRRERLTSVTLRGVDPDEIVQSDAYFARQLDQWVADFEPVLLAEVARYVETLKMSPASGPSA